MLLAMHCKYTNSHFVQTVLIAMHVLCKSRIGKKITKLPLKLIGNMTKISHTQPCGIVVYYSYMYAGHPNNDLMISQVLSEVLF